MSYAPTQSQTQPPAALAISDPTAALDWVPESGSGATQHDAWLVSFIDILILLLALFVLLLTYHQDATGPMDKAGKDTADPVTNAVAGAEPVMLALELPVLLSAPHSVAEIFNAGDELTVRSLAGTNNKVPVETNPPPAEPVSEPALPAPPAPGVLMSPDKRLS